MGPLAPVPLSHRAFEPSGYCVMERRGSDPPCLPDRLSAFMSDLAADPTDRFASPALPPTLFRLRRVGPSPSPASMAAPERLTAPASVSPPASVTAPASMTASASAAQTDAFGRPPVDQTAADVGPIATPVMDNAMDNSPTPTNHFAATPSQPVAPDDEPNGHTGRDAAPSKRSPRETPSAVWDTLVQNRAVIVIGILVASAAYFSGQHAATPVSAPNVEPTVPDLAISPRVDTPSLEPRMPVDRPNGDPAARVASRENRSASTATFGESNDSPIGNESDRDRAGDRGAEGLDTADFMDDWYGQTGGDFRGNQSRFQTVASTSTATGDRGTRPASFQTRSDSLDPSKQTTLQSQTPQAIDDWTRYMPSPR